VPVPPTLRETILAGAKFSHPRRWWARSRIWAAAAAVALLAALGAFWQMKSARLDTWQTDSLAVLDSIEKGAALLDTENAQPAHLVNWLREHAAPAPAAIPPALAASPSFGCKTIDSNGRKISLICFNLGGADQAHLFTTSRTGLRIAPPDKQPIFRHMRHWNLASWSSGGDVHMLATQMDETRLRALLPATVALRAAPASVLLGALLPNR
jgi:hypothetical protein